MYVYWTALSPLAQCSLTSGYSQESVDCAHLDSRKVVAPLLKTCENLSLASYAWAESLWTVRERQRETINFKISCPFETIINRKQEQRQEYTNLVEDISHMTILMWLVYVRLYKFRPITEWQVPATTSSHEWHYRWPQLTIHCNISRTIIHTHTYVHTLLWLLENAD